jgi:hypothetical protein
MSSIIVSSSIGMLLMPRNYVKWQQKWQQCATKSVFSAKEGFQGGECGLRIASQMNGDSEAVALKHYIKEAGVEEIRKAVFGEG